jgi:hypothetical protein
LSIWVEHHRHLDDREGPAAELGECTGIGTWVVRERQLQRRRVVVEGHDPAQRVMGRDRIVAVCTRCRDEVEAGESQRRGAAGAIGLGLRWVVAMRRLGRRVEERDPRGGRGRRSNVTGDPRLDIGDAGLLSNAR